MEYFLSFCWLEKDRTLVFQRSHLFKNQNAQQCYLNSFLRGVVCIGGDIAFFYFFLTLNFHFCCEVYLNAFYVVIIAGVARIRLLPYDAN